MSSPNINALTVGIQHLYKYGLLPSRISVSALEKSSSTQLNKLASAATARQQTDALFSDSTSTSDTATLSSKAANALTQAVNAQLTNNVNAAVDKFTPKSATPVLEDTTGSQINVLA